MNHETIAVLDYGSQYSQLICRRVREAHVFAELIPWDRADSMLPTMNLRGIILSGGPNSVYDPGAPTLPEIVLQSGVPVLGICYGLQLLTQSAGGVVRRGTEREYGSALIQLSEGESRFRCVLFDGLPEQMQVWMSHGDRVENLPSEFMPMAHSANSPYAVVAHRDLLLARRIHASIAAEAKRLSALVHCSFRAAQII